jgi:hypothetical protein
MTGWKDFVEKSGGLQGDCLSTPHLTWQSFKRMTIINRTSSVTGGWSESALLQLYSGRAVLTQNRELFDT